MADTGRPTDYTQDLADLICSELSAGKSLRTVCDSDDMPHRSTVFRWIREHEEFRDQYARAKEEASDAFVEEILDIADNGTNDWNERYDKEGNFVGWQVNGEHIQRSRVRIDTRKWIAGKLKPKKYGDKLDLTSDGEKLEMAPLVVSEIKARGKDDEQTTDT